MFLFRLISSIRLIWKLLTDSRVPFWIRIALPLALIYVISPIDILPDFIPVMGRVDDIIAVVAGIMILLKLAPKKVVNQHKKDNQTIIDGEYREEDQEDQNKNGKSE
tara:strand:- start:1371 stop:1691 length:321 start_codon:yes stop_codon:yes gene_type:complete